MSPICTDSADAALIRIGDSSALVHALSWPGRLLMRAWPESLAARALSGWLSIPLDVRVRLVALVASVAVVTHVSLTGFRAPQPTPVARAAWGCVLLILMAVLIGARPIAAAWRDRRVRRSTAREGETG